MMQKQIGIHVTLYGVDGYFLGMKYMSEHDIRQTMVNHRAVEKLTIWRRAEPICYVSRNAAGRWQMPVRV